MDLKQRADLVRSIRFEIKQRRDRPAAPQTSQEERDRNTVRWIRTVDRRRPRNAPGASQEQQNATRAAVRAYEADPSRRGGFEVGERLRELHRSGRTREMGDEARSAVSARMNVRMPVQTRYQPGTRRNPLQPNTTMRIFTPSERVNAVTASRRHGVTAGLAPPAPGESGHDDYVRRTQEGGRRNRDRIRRQDLFRRITGH